MRRRERPQLLPSVFIDDLVRGFLLALEREQAVASCFLICGPRYVSQERAGVP